MVDANGISTEVLHEVSVERALVIVDERIFWEELIRNACCLLLAKGLSE